MKPGIPWVAALAALSTLACTRPDDLISDEQFIEAVVGLRRAAYASSDTAGFDVRRDSVLGAVGVTEAQLDEFIRVRARDPRRLAAAWDSANARLRAGPPQPQPQLPRSE